MNTKEHQQATYDAAAEAIVLLKNQNNLLPLEFLLDQESGGNWR